MAVADVVERVLAGEHGDFVLEAVALVTRELMEAEISQEVGAELGEVSTERTTHRNGYGRSKATIRSSTIVGSTFGFACRRRSRGRSISRPWRSTARFQR